MKSNAPHRYSHSRDVREAIRLKPGAQPVVMLFRHELASVEHEVASAPSGPCGCECRTSL
jgi:hypothetical protein